MIGRKERKNKEKNSADHAYPIGRGISKEPENSPGPKIFKLDPKSILHSLRNDTVQKGRTKSWLSMCGGIQSPSS